ncbi:MAG: hypothetical protein NUV91_09385 [Candidatus Omnitrophica bacterium]|nr:hypothetical protein [Candidatus Omnitrophota bacterium]
MKIREPIPEDIKRFILRSIDSVPHLEAILLLRYDPKIEWDGTTMAQRLYISEKKATELLTDLCAAGFASKEKDGFMYFYNPISSELKELINRLAEIYTKNLIEVTNLIHSKTNKQAQTFGDAFKWQKEKD